MKYTHLEKICDVAVNWDLSTSEDHGSVPPQQVYAYGSSEPSPRFLRFPRRRMGEKTFMLSCLHPVDQDVKLSPVFVQRVIIHRHPHTETGTQWAAHWGGREWGGGLEDRKEGLLFQLVPALLLSHVWLFATLWTVACQAPLSMGFSREYWTGMPFPYSGDLPDPGVEPESTVSPASQAESLPAEPLRKPHFSLKITLNCTFEHYQYIHLIQIQFIQINKHVNLKNAKSYSSTG